MTVPQCKDGRLVPVLPLPNKKRTAKNHVPSRFLTQGSIRVSTKTDEHIDLAPELAVADVIGVIEKLAITTNNVKSRVEGCRST